MINLSLNKQLDIIVPNKNRALALVLEQASQKDLEILSKDRDLGSIINSLLKESSKNSDKTLLDLAKNNPTLKDLGNISTTLKELLNSLKSEKNPLEATLKNFLLDMKDLSEKTLKEKFENSGVFLESKLKNAQDHEIKEILSKDLKAVLLKASEELGASAEPHHREVQKQVDKLLLQIDYYQLTSHLSNSSSLYLPFSWDNLEEGSIDLKKDKDDKFYCDIDLKLQEYGEVKLKLTLYEKNQINIHIYAQNSDFREIIKENLPLLRSLLTEAQITPRELRIFDTPKKISPYGSEYKHIDLGFEVKV